MSARDALSNALWDNYTQAQKDEFIDAFAHELAERLRNVHGSGEGDAWNWWNAADIPAACADLIDPLKDAT